MKRYCYQCKAEIFECMGSVHAGSFLDFIKKEDLSIMVHELCPKCASYYANIEEAKIQYPSPDF